MEPASPSPQDRSQRRTIGLLLTLIFLLPVVAVILVLLSTVFDWQLPIGNKDRRPTPVEAPGQY